MAYFSDFKPRILWWLLRRHPEWLVLWAMTDGAGGPTEWEGENEETTSVPATFADFLAAMVGEWVRVSVQNAVDNALTLVGILHAVGSDYLVLKAVVAGGVALGPHERVAIPLSNVAGVDRLPFWQRWLPILSEEASS